MILFYIDIMFIEVIKIIRFLNGKNWIKGVDLFYIFYLVCYYESIGGWSCNVFYIIDKIENDSCCFCFCICFRKNFIVIYIENKWRCLKNREV